MGFSVFMWSAMWVIQLIVSLCGVQWVSVSVEHNVGFSVCEHDVEFQCLCGAWCGVSVSVWSMMLVSVFMWSTVWVSVSVWSMVWIFSVCVEHGVGVSVCVEHGVGFSVCVEHGVGFSVCVEQGVHCLLSLGTGTASPRVMHRSFTKP